MKSMFHTCALALCLAATVHPVWAQKTFIVNTLSDWYDGNPGDGICLAVNEVCSLRAAIEEANATPNGASPDVILFTDIPVENGVAVIPLNDDQLPWITDAVIIDASTAPGVVRLEREHHTADARGLTLSGAGANGSTIRGLTVSGGGFDAAIVIILSDNNLIENNVIGTDANEPVPSNSAGIVIVGNENSVINNTLGYTEVGIVINYGAGNTIQGNYIGVDEQGQNIGSPVGEGILVQNVSGPSSGTLIGGSFRGQGNTIGFYKTGVSLQGMDHVVRGNFIGTNARGENLGNYEAGIFLWDGHNAVIGGGPDSLANVIGFNRNGIVLDEGIVLRDGIVMYGGASGNRIMGNYIGVNRRGLDIGNFGDAIRIEGTAVDNQIGCAAVAIMPDDAPRGNVIAGNGGAGIRAAAGDASTGYTLGNAMRGNRIYDNREPGIDLGDDNVDLNDPGDGDDGPNNRMNYPDIEQAFFTSDLSHVVVTYSIPTGPSNANFPLVVDFYLAGQDLLPEARAYLDTDRYETPGTSVTVEIPYPGGVFTEGDVLVATATDVRGNTSEFSFPVRPAVDLGAEPTPVEPLPGEIPGTHVLSAAYPNPFNPQTTFTLAVRDAGRVRIAVHDALGRRVALLHDGDLAPGLTHTFTFDGAGLASGTYLLRVSGERFVETRPLMLVK